MCQWSVNLRSRLKDFPLPDAERLDDQIVSRLVPKFHLAAHKESCRVNFSLNYEPGVGRSDMEGPERTWFGLQGGGSTKDQGPGYWSDAMDDKFGHWNWSKLIRLGRVPLVLFPSKANLTCFQVHCLQRNIPLLLCSQLSIKTSLLLFASMSPMRFSVCGLCESPNGNLIERSRTHTSALPLV